MNSPVAYRVINRRLVESLARSLDLPVGESLVSEAELGASRVISGKVKNTRSSPPLTSADPRLIPPIVTALRESGQLRIYRPESTEDFWRRDHDNWYVWERTVATPVTLSLKGKFPDEVEGPAALNVWISDPPTRVEIKDEWDFRDSFLLLVEELGEFTWPMPWFISGVSALRLVAEVLEDPRPLTMEWLMAIAQSEDRFGRWRADHPVEKLRQIGGIVGRPRLIETVYKVVYMTDEQAYETDGGQTRVSDLLAYPLYIAD